MEAENPSGVTEFPSGGVAAQWLEQQSDHLASLMLLGLPAAGQDDSAPLDEVRELLARIAGGAERLALVEVLRQTQSLLALIDTEGGKPGSGGGSSAESMVSVETRNGLEQGLVPLHEAMCRSVDLLKRAAPSSEGGFQEADAQPDRAEVCAPGNGFGLADDVELLREFLVEAAGHLEAIESGALALETDLADRETLNLLFRAFHSIKGLAGFLEISAIQHTAHELENLLDSARDGLLQMDRDAIDLILDTHSYLGDALAMVADRIAGKMGVPIQEDPSLLARIASYHARGTANGAADPVNPIHCQEASPRIPDSGSHPPQATGEVLESASPPIDDSSLQQGGCSEVDKVGSGGHHEALDPPPPVADALSRAEFPEPAVALVDQGSCSPDVPLSVMRTARPSSSDGATERGVSAARTNAAGAVVKIDTEKLDYLVDMVGELVIAQSMVRHDPLFESSQSATLLKNMAQMTRVTAEVQRVAMSMRMVPIKGLFQRMSRLARDLARKYTKQVRVDLEGEETELDRTLIEQLADPMMHMVRNAIDHGLEDAGQREASGKPSEGVIKLSAIHQSGSILISIEDDGKGLDRKRILEKARSRGLVHENATLNDAQIDQLIFEPGFSTATVVSDLSGRGVGMDVVRRNIQQLRGRVEVQSQPGRGTAMRMKLPLTLAIIDGLVVGVHGERFIIPLFSVREMFRADAKAISHVQDGQEVLQVRGNILPVVRLRRRLNLASSQGQDDALLCLVVESARSVYCLLVDEFIGKQEVVIKSLGEQFADIPGIAAGAILGDGTVGLILDMEGVFEGVSAN